MPKLSINELKTKVASIVTKAKLSNGSFVESHDNAVGLIDKIGKIVTLDSVYAIDKLAFMDGKYLEYGKTIEEWQEDLIGVSDYDSTGAGALSPSDPSYRPVFYSYTIGRKVIKQTIRNNELERAVNNASQLVSLVAMKTKRIQDSMAMYRYQVKREMFAKLIDLVDDEQGTTTTYAVSTAYSVGACLRKASSGDDANVKGIVVKAITSTSYATINTWADNVANGYIILLDLVTEIAKPVDTETGEAFIEQVKKDVEVAKDFSEGHSLNGNTLGAIEGLKLVVAQGLLPSIQVQTLAGAFNKEDLGIEASVEVIKDFASDTTGVYAVLIDSRAMRLHNTYRAMRDNMNGDGDFLNLFDHTEDTAWISRNAFVKIYREPSL